MPSGSSERRLKVPWPGEPPSAELELLLSPPPSVCNCRKPTRKLSKLSTSTTKHLLMLQQPNKSLHGSRSMVHVASASPMQLFLSSFPVVSIISTQYMPTACSQERCHCSDTADSPVLPIDAVSLFVHVVSGRLRRLSQRSKSASTA